MPTKKYLHNIDLDQNQLVSPVLHNLSAAPTGAVDGQLYYNTTTKKVYYYNSTTATWTEVGAVYNIYNLDGTLTGNRTVTLSGNTITFSGNTSSVGVIFQSRVNIVGGVFLSDFLSFNGSTSANKTIFANSLTFTTNNEGGYGSDQSVYTFTTQTPGANSGSYTSTLVNLLMPVNTGTQAANSRALLIDFSVTTNAGALTAIQNVRGNNFFNSTDGNTYIGHSSAPTTATKFSVNGTIQFGTTNKTITNDNGEFNVLSLQSGSFLLFEGRTNFNWGIKKSSSTDICIRAGGGADTQFVFNSSNRFGINISPDSIIHTNGSVTVVFAGGVVAKGVDFSNTIVASHNNDKLIGLDVNTTFTTSGFTGVNTIDLRTSGLNVVFGSSIGYTGFNAANPEIDGAIQFIKNGSYGTKIILRPAGNPGGINGGGGFTGNYWGSIEQNESSLSFTSGAYQPMNFLNGSALRMSILTGDGIGKVLMSNNTGVGVTYVTGTVGYSTITTSVDAVSGTLAPGTYYYRIVAYDENKFLSISSAQLSIVIPAGSSTNKVTITGITLPVGCRFYRVYRGTTTNTYSYISTGYDQLSTFTDIGFVTNSGSYAPQNITNTGTLAGFTHLGILYAKNFFGRQIVLNRESSTPRGLYVVSTTSSDSISESNMGPGSNYVFGNMAYANTSTWSGTNIAIGETTGASGYVVMSNSITIGADFGYPYGPITYTDSLLIGYSIGYAAAAGTTVTKSTVIQNGTGYLWSSLGNVAATAKSLTSSFIWKAPWTSGDYRTDSFPDTLSNVAMFGSGTSMINDVWFGNGGTGVSGITNYTIHGSEIAFDPSATVVAQGGTNLLYFNNSVGGSIILAGGRGRGTGTGGDVIFQTSSVAASGTTLQTLTSRWYIKYNTGTLSNVASPNASAALQIDSTTQGFLPPRMTGAEANNISNKATGLILYVTTTATGLTTAPGWFGWDGSVWKKLDN